MVHGDGGAVRGRRDKRARGKGGEEREAEKEEQTPIVFDRAPLPVYRARARAHFVSRTLQGCVGERTCRQTWEGSAGGWSAILTW